MSIKLRDLIRSVRACKTAAEERAVISKECALIRTAIKEENEIYRNRNVAKLLYIHMLGYPTHFGQMECLKLISAPSFPEKRIGYLGLTLLLTENTEVLTLVTNSLKVDLVNSNQYIVALALIAIGNLATQDMARDLASDVDKLLRSNNSYLRKKAALATIRLIKKEPDVIEHMSERIVSLLKDRSHGVLVGGVQLMIDICEVIPEYVEEYRQLVPSLVRLLRNFISMGYSPEHDVGGITDPFLQVKLLRLLRLLGKGNEEASDHMNDVLAQVATNTETTKNAGNAILYECVQTIMDVVSDSSLHVLAVNILGRFLLNRDNNIRYVALNTLSKVVADDISAVQRHRATIVDCLKDSDISIRQRALELIYQLVDDSNVEVLTTELLNYLVVAHSEHKANLVAKIMSVVERFSPTAKWRIDTIITMLSIAGNHTSDAVPKTTILFIAQASELYAYATHRLYKILRDDTSQITLVNVGIWCIGEYGELLLQPCTSGDTSFSPARETDVIAFLDKCLRIHNSDNATKALVLNALMKLSVRFSMNVSNLILDIISTYKTSMVLELQQRSTEYSTLLSSQWNHLRRDLLDKMPILDESVRKRKGGFEEMRQLDEDALTPMATSTGGKPVATPAPASKAKPATESFLLDLDDIFGGGAPAPAPSAAMSNMSINGTSSPPSSSSNDLLADIFSNNAPLSPTPAQPSPSYPPQPPVQQYSQAPDPIQSVMSSAPSNPMIKAFEKNGLVVMMELSKPDPSNPSQTKILCRFSNTTQSSFTNLVFQVKPSQGNFYGI